jgi:glycine dehydrogenase subunit 2
LDRLDHFAAAMEQIAREAAESPDVLHQAPHTTPVDRLDEGRAARELKLRWSVPGAVASPPEVPAAARR